MKGYESRVWVCWLNETISHGQPKECDHKGSSGTPRWDSHDHCGLHDVLVPVVAPPRTRVRRIKKQKEGQVNA